MQLRSGQIQGREHTREEMGGSDQIDVVGALVLERKKNFRQSFRGYGFSYMILADLVVLAETTFQAASGKEYSTASSAAAYAGLLPKMKGCPCTADFCFFAAKSWKSAAVCTAVSGTKAAAGHIK